jgi:hypothetical protein
MIILRSTCHDQHINEILKTRHNNLHKLNLNKNYNYLPGSSNLIQLSAPRRKDTVITVSPPPPEPGYRGLQMQFLEAKNRGCKFMGCPAPVLARLAAGPACSTLFSVHRENRQYFLQAVQSR